MTVNSKKESADVSHCFRLIRSSLSSPTASSKGPVNHGLHRLCHTWSPRTPFQTFCAVATSHLPPWKVIGRQKTWFWLWRVYVFLLEPPRDRTTVPAHGVFQILYRCALDQPNHPILHSTTNNSTRPDPTMALVLQAVDLYALTGHSLRMEVRLRLLSAGTDSHTTFLAARP